jgi:hypothetical protein
MRRQRSGASDTNAMALPSAITDAANKRASMATHCRRVKLTARRARLITSARPAAGQPFGG